LGPPVAECLVLDPAADLVQTPVGDSHDVEGIGHPPGVIEIGRQPGPEALGQVHGHDLDPCDPSGVGASDPTPQVRGTVALDHVDEAVAAEVDESGGVDGGVGAVGSQERRLVDAQLAHTADAGGIVEEG
jgi:hypothetical protein